MSDAANEKLVLALPKGRIISEVMPVLARWCRRHFAAISFALRVRRRAEHHL